MAERRTRRTKPKGPTYTTESIKRVRSPRATAAFAHLSEPDNAFNKVQYTITAYFDKDDPEFQEYVKDLKAEAKTLGHSDIPMKSVTQGEHDKAKQGKYPELAKDVGTPYYQFNCAATDEREERGGIPVYGPDAKLMEDGEVWGGDTVRVSGSLCEWKSSEGTGGLKVYLGGVQFLKRNRIASPAFEPDTDFLDEEDSESGGFAAEGEDDVDTSEEDVEGEEEDFNEDDIPF